MIKTEDYLRCFVNFANYFFLFFFKYLQADFAFLYKLNYVTFYIHFMKYILTNNKYENCLYKEIRQFLFIV